MTEHKQPSQALVMRQRDYGTCAAIAHFGGDKRIALAIERASNLPPVPPLEPWDMEELFKEHDTDPLRDVLWQSVKEANPDGIDSAEAFIDRLTEAVRRNGKGMVL